MRIGRCVSALIGRAALNGSSTRLIQMLRTPLYGLRNVSHFPSGEIWAPLICTSPKNAVRSTSGGWSAFATAANAAANTTAARKGRNLKAGCSGTRRATIEGVAQLLALQLRNDGLRQLRGACS